jgi:hypothetical protein
MSGVLEAMGGEVRSVMGVEDEIGDDIVVVLVVMVMREKGLVVVMVDVSGCG